MDPQQRLLLEIGYEATHGALLLRQDLLGCNIGVFVGIMNTDFAALGGSASVYAATSTQISITSGRLSFALGLQGPCTSIDTACSSALVALEAGVLSLRASCSEAALAAAAETTGRRPRAALYGISFPWVRRGNWREYVARRYFGRQGGLRETARDTSTTGGEAGLPQRVGEARAADSRTLDHVFWEGSRAQPRDPLSYCAAYC